ncbi:hypothetical protein MTO96_039017 [Rhipicephalus appendiculatus]
MIHPRHHQRFLRTSAMIHLRPHQPFLWTLAMIHLRPHQRFLWDTCSDPCGFPMTYDGAPTSQTEISSCQVSVVAPMACGYDVLGWSCDLGRYYPEISGIFDPPHGS